MSDHLVFVDDVAEVRQGDIIRRFPSDSQESEVWGFIVTADCDIAQNKARSRYTWLEIVRSADFLETYWATEQLRRHVDKHSRLSCTTINAMIRRSERELTELTSASLCEWLAGDSPENIIKQISPNAKVDTKLVNSLQSIKIALGTEGSRTQIDRLKHSWALTGRDEKSQRASIQEAFNGEQGFPDFVLVPELPKSTHYGFVVLLRSINSIKYDEVFLSETDARINDRPYAFHRVGRFSDGLRFAIAQKLAFLFSRIGMPPAFEAACEAATELLVEGVYKAGGDVE